MEWCTAGTRGACNTAPIVQAHTDWHAVVSTRGVLASTGFVRVSEAREPLAPVYAIWGEDRGKVERALRRLQQRVQSEGGMPPEVSEAAQTPAADVVAACETLSFGGTRLVVVRGADAWRADDVAPLVEYLA